MENTETWTCCGKDWTKWMRKDGDDKSPVPFAFCPLCGKPRPTPTISELDKQQAIALDHAYVDTWCKVTDLLTKIEWEEATEQARQASAEFLNKARKILCAEYIAEIKRLDNDNVELRRLSDNLASEIDLAEKRGAATAYDTIKHEAAGLNDHLYSWAKRMHNAYRQAVLDHCGNTLLNPEDSDDTKDVHTEHCCALHGCKYSDPNCTVESGQKQQSYPCEDCQERDE